METNNKYTKEYIQNGSVFLVRREFENCGTSLLEQVVSMLLDLMEKQQDKN